MKDKIKNMMRLFLDSIRDYEHENGDRICMDERESEEFVNIFLESEDAFDYNEVTKDFADALALLEQAAPIWRSDTERWEYWHKHQGKLHEKYKENN